VEELITLKALQMTKCLYVNMDPCMDQQALSFDQTHLDSVFENTIERVKMIMTTNTLGKR